MWKATGIDPVEVARKLWKDSRVGKPYEPVGAAVREDPQPAPSSAADIKAP